jgi:predicted TIM-barrel fold metal-dependent hydrolase
MADVLRQHPRLTAVIAHGGAPEYAEHLGLARRYPNVHLDTTMVGTYFLERIAPVPAEVRAGYADMGERIVLGSDFPNIPYPYAEQLDALERWNMGDDWLRQVVYENGTRLLRL